MSFVPRFPATSQAAYLYHRFVTGAEAGALVGDATFTRPIAKENVAKFLMAAISSDEWESQRGMQLAGRK